VYGQGFEKKVRAARMLRYFGADNVKIFNGLLPEINKE
jgi:3-mercaptopyruvate sulfurtransferase SseA